MASKYWRESNVTLIEKLENLEKDCLNAPYHYFGIHENCSDYFCKKTTTPQSVKTIDDLKSAGLFHELLNYCNIYFASNVKSLLEDFTTNAAEELNSVIAKYLGNSHSQKIFLLVPLNRFYLRWKANKLFTGWFIFSSMLGSCCSV